VSNPRRQRTLPVVPHSIILRSTLLRPVVPPFDWSSVRPFSRTQVVQGHTTSIRDYCDSTSLRPFFYRHQLPVWPLPDTTASAVSPSTFSADTMVFDFCGHGGVLAWTVRVSGSTDFLRQRPSQCRKRSILVYTHRSVRRSRTPLVLFRVWYDGDPVGRYDDDPVGTGTVGPTAERPSASRPSAVRLPSAGEASSDLHARPAGWQRVL